MKRASAQDWIREATFGGYISFQLPAAGYQLFAIGSELKVAGPGNFAR